MRKPVAKKTKFVKLKVPKSGFRVPKIKSTLSRKRWKY